MGNMLSLSLAFVAACTSPAPSSVEVVASGLDQPVDSTPTSDGSRFYALTATSIVTITDGTSTPLVAGAPLVGARNLAISADDATLYVADPIADTMFSVSTAD